MTVYTSENVEAAAGDQPLYHNAMLGVVPTTPLPYGYYYAETVSASEVAELLQQADLLNSRSPDDLSEIIQDGFESFGVATLGVNVREARTRRLIGTGALHVGEWDGVLFDFAVAPDRRGQGIGGAILAERMMQAERLALEDVRVRLASTNTLKDRYLAMGFRVLGGNVLRHLYGARPELVASAHRSTLFRSYDMLPPYLEEA